MIERASHQKLAGEMQHCIQERLSCRSIRLATVPYCYATARQNCAATCRWMATSAA